MPLTVFARRQYYATLATKAKKSEPRNLDGEVGIPPATGSCRTGMWLLDYTVHDVRGADLHAGHDQAPQPAPSRYD